MKHLSSLLLVFFCATALRAQNGLPATNYLGTSNTISFQKKAYNLAWSSHPTAAYYKQEYLLKGENVNRFATMLLLEAVTGAVSLQDAVAAKSNELTALKKKNPVVQFEVFDNKKTGEYLLDFLLTAPAPDGSVAIVERNVYRYKSFTAKNGATGVLLFGISERSYGSDVQSFLTKLKREKTVLVNAVAAMPWPDVKL